jgi:hypothetical protein
MLERLPSKHGLIFGSFLYRTDLVLKADLLKLWSDQWAESASFVPTHNPLSNYYQKEMGPSEHLERFFVVSLQSAPRDQLLQSKLIALEWENTLASNGNRTVNIDTGIITLENFLLATTKNYSHRVFIGEDIFADLTYQFVHGSYQPLPWCYPDYQDSTKIEFITWCRSYLSNLLTR